MLNKYENLIKLYYKKQNIKGEYTKRIKNPTTFITDLKINPIKRENKRISTNLNFICNNPF